MSVFIGASSRNRFLYPANDRGVEDLSLEEIVQRLTRREALHRACSIESLDSVRPLVTRLSAEMRVAVFMHKDSTGSTPIHHACRYISVPTVFVFLLELIAQPEQLGEILEVCDANQESVLHRLCTGENVPVLLPLLERMPLGHRLFVTTDGKNKTILDRVLFQLHYDEHRKEFNSWHDVFFALLGKMTDGQILQLGRERGLLHELAAKALQEEVQKRVFPPLLARIDQQSYVALLQSHDEDGFMPLHIVCMYPKNGKKLKMMLAKIPQDAISEILVLKSTRGLSLEACHRDEEYRAIIRAARLKAQT